MTSDPPDRKLHGREAELAAIGERLERAKKNGSALVIAGDPGIGKTALVTAARDLALAEGFRVLATSGVQSEADLPYSGLHQLLGPLADRVESLPVSQGDALRGALGLAEATEDDPYLTGLATLNLLGDAAEERRLLLIAEDAHWLDRATTAALAFVARRLEADAMMLLISTRGNPPHPIRMARLDTIELRALEPDAAAAVVAERAPDLDPADRRALLDQASGNPLALIELPTGGGPAEPAPLPDWLPLPTRLERAFAARYLDLPPATRTTLAVAALDDSGDLALTFRVAGTVTGEAPGPEVLEPALAAGLATTDGTTLRFRHPLVRHAIRQDAAAGLRQSIHATLASELSDQPERAIWHRVGATVGTDDELAAELAATAETARRRGSVLTAIRILERAADICGPGGRAAYLLDGAELALEIGRLDLVGQLTARAAEGTVPEEHADRRDWLLETAVRDPLDPETLLDLVDRSERLLRAGDPVRGAEVLVTVAFRCWWWAPPAELRGRVVAAASLLGETPQARQRLLVLSLVDPLGHGTELVEALSALDPAEVDARDLRLLAVSAAILGIFDRAVLFADLAVERLRAGGGYGTLVPALVARAWAGVFVGEWNSARGAADEAARVAMETGQPLWAVSANAAAGALAGLRRSEETALGLVGLAETILPPGLADGMWTLTEAARGLTALAAGRPEDAATHLGSVVSLDQGTPGAYVGSWLIGAYADACVGSGRTAAAVALAGRFERMADESGLPYLKADVKYARAVLADPAAAAARFDEAARAAGEIPLLRARIDLARGIALRREGDTESARTPLRAARDACDALGAGVLGDVAREELRGAGEASGGPVTSGRDQLTPQELQIAEMAAAGRTNREIGEQLFLSHRTVGSHLYRIFPKLGIVSRGELRDALGLVGQPA